MELRFIERDGKKILQQQSPKQWSNKPEDIIWEDVPLVEEPEKPREFIVEATPGVLNPRCWPTSDTDMLGLLKYEGNPPRHEHLIKVREVLE